VKNKYRETAALGESPSRGREVAGQNIGFADSIIAKETIGRLGVGPVLAGSKCSAAYFARQLLQQLSQRFAVAYILKLTFGGFD
jgi:hypothetical protein